MIFFTSHQRSGTNALELFQLKITHKSILWVTLQPTAGLCDYNLTLKLPVFALCLSRKWLQRKKKSDESDITRIGGVLRSTSAPNVFI